MYAVINQVGTAQSSDLSAIVDYAAELPQQFLDLNDGSPHKGFDAGYKITPSAFKVKRLRLFIASIATFRFLLSKAVKTDQS